VGVLERPKGIGGGGEGKKDSPSLGQALRRKGKEIFFPGKKRGNCLFLVEKERYFLITDKEKKEKVGMVRHTTNN